mgnify:CR=1 FL=1
MPIAAAERGDLEADRAAVAFNHRFNRLAFQLRAAIRDFDFAPVPSLGGGPISNDDRDELERDAAFRTTWDFGGGFGVFLKTAIADRRYHTPPRRRYLAPSAGEQYRAGVSPLPRCAIPSAARSAWAGTPAAERRPTARPRWRADRRQSRLARLGAHHLPVHRPVDLYRSRSPSAPAVGSHASWDLRCAMSSGAG